MLRDEFLIKRKAAKEEKQRIFQLPLLRLIENKKYVDATGNLLTRGDVVCLSDSNKKNLSGLRFGVFLGLIERKIVTSKATVYTIQSIQKNLGSYIDWIYTFKANYEPELAVALYGKTNKLFLKKLSEKDDMISSVVLVQRPEFAVHNPMVAKCFSLMDDLKDGIFKELENVEDKE